MYFCQLYLENNESYSTKVFKNITDTSFTIVIIHHSIIIFGQAVTVFGNKKLFLIEP